MKLLKSIEELLYELVTWFLFYPLTLWRILSHPVRMLAYAEKELTGGQDSQYDDSLSPPILLLLTLVLLHAFGGAIGGPHDAVLPGFLADNRNLLVFRSVAFSLIPLLFAVSLRRLRGARLTRSTLKPAFYSQSYAAVPFIILSSIGLAMMLNPEGSKVMGGVLFAGATAWFLAVETVWFSREATMGLPRAAGLAVVTLIGSLIILLAAAAIVELAASTGDFDDFI